MNYGAAKELYKEGKLIRLPAESLDLMRAAALSMRNGGDLEKITDDREDELLRIVSKQEKPLVITVYGGSHTWGGHKSLGQDYSLKGRKTTRDNLAEWNTKNPDKKFSLIEITPNSYAKGEKLGIWD